MSIITSSTLAVVHLPLITVDRQSLFITSSPFVVVVFVFFRLLRESFPRTSKSKGWCHFFPPRIIGSATSSIREKKKTFQRTEVKCYFFTVRKTKLNHANQLTRSGNVSYSPHSTHTYQIAAVFWCTSHNHNRSFTASEISVDHVAYYLEVRGGNVSDDVQQTGQSAGHGKRDTVLIDFYCALFASYVVAFDARPAVGNFSGTEHPPKIPRVWKMNCNNLRFRYPGMAISANVIFGTNG